MARALFFSLLRRCFPDGFQRCFPTRKLPPPLIVSPEAVATPPSQQILTGGTSPALAQPREKILPTDSPTNRGQVAPSGTALQGLSPTGGPSEGESLGVTVGATQTVRQWDRGLVRIQTYEALRGETEKEYPMPGAPRPKRVFEVRGTFPSPVKSGRSLWLSKAGGRRAAGGEAGLEGIHPTRGTRCVFGGPPGSTRGPCTGDWDEVPMGLSSLQHEDGRTP